MHLKVCGNDKLKLHIQHKQLCFPCVRYKINVTDCLNKLWKIMGLNMNPYLLTYCAHITRMFLSYFFFHSAGFFKLKINKRNPSATFGFVRSGLNSAKCGKTAAFKRGMGQMLALPSCVFIKLSLVCHNRYGQCLRVHYKSNSNQIKPHYYDNFRHGKNTESPFLPCSWILTFYVYKTCFMTNVSKTKTF